MWDMKPIILAAAVCFTLGVCAIAPAQQAGSEWVNMNQKAIALSH